MVGVRIASIAGRSALATIGCLLLLAPGPATAGAALTIDSFTVATPAPDASPNRQAGAVTEVRASFALGQSGGTPETAKDAVLGLPGGFSVNPSAVPHCSLASFASFECPAVTQVGLVTVRAEVGGDPSSLLGTAPVYALVAGPEEPARLGFVVPTVEAPVAVPVTLRSEADYGPDLEFRGLPQPTPVTGINLTLWGVPADPGHDPQRFPAGAPDQPAGCPGVDGTGCLSGSTPSAAPAAPLLRNPSSCAGELQSRLDLTTYEATAATATATIPARLGCGVLGFSPQLFAELTTAETNSHSGLDLGLLFSQEGFFNPEGVADSAAKSLSVELPPGLTVDADAAAGQETCSEAQFEAEPVTCPPGSAVGTFALVVAGLEAPLAGAAYFGTPAPAGAHRLFLTASGSGVDAKFVARLESDPESGQVTAALPSLPELALEELKLQLSDAAGLLVTPTRCGTYLADATITPWASPNEPVFAQKQIVLDSVGPDEGPCPGPAADVGVSLSPPQIVADGGSTSVATATVTDADGVTVPGEEVTFSATDPGLQFGPVADHGDGTYSATILASTRAGTATIVATDTSVEPAVAGATTLTLTAPPIVIPPANPLPPPPAGKPRPPRPVATVVRRPPRRSPDRTPTFRFRSNIPGSTFACRIDARPFRPCASPKTFGPLPYGPHTFHVRATTPNGVASEPATWKFLVRKP